MFIPTVIYRHTLFLYLRRGQKFFFLLSSVRLFFENVQYFHQLLIGTLISVWRRQVSITKQSSFLKGKLLYYYSFSYCSSRFCKKNRNKHAVPKKRPPWAAIRIITVILTCSTIDPYDDHFSKGYIAMFTTGLFGKWVRGESLSIFRPSSDRAWIWQKIVRPAWPKHTLFFRQQQSLRVL